MGVPVVLKRFNTAMIALSDFGPENILVSVHVVISTLISSELDMSTVNKVPITFPLHEIHLQYMHVPLHYLIFPAIKILDSQHEN